MEILSEEEVQAVTGAGFILAERAPKKSTDGFFLTEGFLLTEGFFLTEGFILAE